jgi:FkbM family methyltransferase
MLTADVEDRFHTAFAIYRGSRMSKLRHGHIKLVYSKLLELALRGLGRGVERKVRLVWGEEMTVVYPEIASLGIARYGFFGEDLTRMVLAHLKSGMTFLDVGAHLGYFSLLAAWLVGDTGQVHSFEPTPRTFELLRLNAGLKRNVRLNRVAVTSRPGIATLNDYGPRFAAFNSMYGAKLPKQARPVKSTKFQVPAISIDEYVAQESLTPNFVKIDAESADYEILTGMEETLNRCRPLISVEVGDMDIDGVHPSKDIVLFLMKKGYQPYEHSGGSIVKHQPKERYEYGDLLFLWES